MLETGGSILAEQTQPYGLGLLVVFRESPEFVGGVALLPVNGYSRYLGWLSLPIGLRALVVNNPSMMLPFILPFSPLPPLTYHTWYHVNFSLLDGFGEAGEHLLRDLELRPAVGARTCSSVAIA